MNEILLIILTIFVVFLFFGAIIGTYIYRKVHHLPTGECACCHTSTKKMLKKYHKMYGQKSLKIGGQE